jgi:hypothetical protein
MQMRSRPLPFMDLKRSSAAAVPFRIQIDPFLAIHAGSPDFDCAMCRVEHGMRIAVYSSFNFNANFDGIHTSDVGYFETEEAELILEHKYVANCKKSTVPQRPCDAEGKESPACEYQHRNEHADSNGHAGIIRKDDAHFLIGCNQDNAGNDENGYIHDQRCL